VSDENTQRRQLEQDGYLVLENAIDSAFLALLTASVEAQFEAEGDSAGAEFKQEPGCRRLANLLNKGEVFQRVVAADPILERVGWVLGPRFKLSSLNARSANPQSGVRQPLHADMGAVADEFGYWVCNCVWLLDDFTPTNGALRVIPGSHHHGKLPEVALEDPLAPHPEEVLLTAKRGTVIILNAHLWHGGTENATDEHRRAVHAFYARHDKPQQQHQKKLISPEVQRTLSPRLRKILALDDPQNDTVSSAPHKRSGFLR
jgi:ectoine hydroxylase-related dioxygenase (phytanoyl-CoA dioxygenase family)